MMFNDANFFHIKRFRTSQEEREDEKSFALKIKDEKRRVKGEKLGLISEKRYENYPPFSKVFIKPKDSSSYFFLLLFSLIFFFN